MMLSASPSMVVRSSLEEMLDSLRQRDENEKPKDLPPALPSRPISIGRLPPARRSLPSNFRVSNEGESQCSVCVFNEKEDSNRKEKDVRYDRGRFGCKKMRKDQNDESPYMWKYGSDKLDQVNFDGASGMSSASQFNVRRSDWDDTIDYYIKKRLHVWCQLPSGQWAAGTIKSASGDEVFIMLFNKDVVKVPAESLLPANPSILDEVDNLVQLSFLNEPSVLHNLRKRYSLTKIYSKAGPVLIALNPFKDVKIYGNDFVVAYREKLTDSPHVFSVAECAYSNMRREEVDQSIILSGQSGSGKTETAKIALQYLVAVAGDSYGMGNRILQSNSILEAFGNAKTFHNDNSSRFGKVIQVQFGSMGKICGAKFQTFSLEKSRVVQFANGERSFHIFYQLCAGAPSLLREKLNLNTASEYKYLNQSECLRIDGVDDSWKFQNLQEALDIIQICKEDKEHMYSMLAVVLWLGNISFQANDGENHVEVVTEEAFTNVTKLLGCKSEDLMLVLSRHKSPADKNSMGKKLTLQQAINSRDAFAIFIYASLFDWLVEQVNMSLEVQKKHSGKSISIFDISGFESFKKNNFEQFCINYANERLQQHFNRHLLKLEQEDCERDGIGWNRIMFKDNQECLNLIEQKPLGLLALLDEESHLPKATDLTFANKLKHHLNGNLCFKGERGRAFGIFHNAGEVIYDTNGFLEKNKDLLPYACIELLSSSNCKALKSFGSSVPNHSEIPTIGMCQRGVFEFSKPTVGASFKEQLFKVFHSLESTSPHFIHCIKPNVKRVHDSFEEELVIQQLKCCNAFEVVQVSKYGYPTRLTHQKFAERYGFLLEESNTSHNPLNRSVAVFQQFNFLPEMYQVGYTKLFFRTGQIEILEEKRQQVLRSILRLQKFFRSRQARNYFQELKNGATMLQSFVRGEIARRKITVVIKWCTSTVPDKTDELQAVIQLQSAIRGLLVRKRYKIVHYLKKLYPEIQESKQKSGRKSFEVQDKRQKQVQVTPSVLAELQIRILKAEANLQTKEEEASRLQEQVQQYEARWSEYTAKMKSMEEIWRKQMSSLQMTLAGGRRSLAAEFNANPPGRVEAPSPQYYDSEDTMSMGSRTPGCSTPLKFSTAISETGTGRDTNGAVCAVAKLVKEFERKKQSFDDDVKVLVEAKSGQSGSVMNPEKEISNLRHRFDSWKKEYKVRLREAKANIRKLGNSDERSSRRKWWGKLSSRAS